jgi:hypothetical protein
VTDTPSPDPIMVNDREVVADLLTAIGALTTAVGHLYGLTLVVAVQKGPSPQSS